jgi:hypothetical protein
MATNYKVLGQNTPTANTITTLYTVPSSNSSVVSTMTICNQSGANAAVDVAICPGNTTVTTSQYIIKNCSVAVNDTVFLTVGLTLADGDTIRVNADSANISFNAYGSEIY